MKQSASKTKKGKIQHLSFYLVMLLCMAMVSVACWFAYSQTKNQLIMELDSAVNSAGDVKVMEMETAIPRNTSPVIDTEPEDETDPEIRSGARPRTEPETEPELETEAVAGIHPLQTAPTEAQPFTQSVAIIDAPETAPETEFQELTETQTEPAFHSTEPACYPLDGEILESFSNGELVKSATTGVWQSHNGIDIAGTLGDAVCAMNAGIVENIENHPLWGVTITIDHQNGIYSRYCNLNTGITVNAGDKVEAGTVIGALGDTADIESAMETHLHFEVLRGEVYLDPIAYIQSTENTANTTTADNAD
ncbi:MAG: M23 family metallopeptidase [Oscillospiraceae bacterium]|nr:M23 family metallopeptidase [Oscillospiraceae bacterium]